MLPKETIVHTVDSLYWGHSNHSHLIYKVVILSVGLGLATLPYIDVAVTVNSPAVIRPSTDKTTIHALVSGIIDKTFVTENVFVNRSDTLYTIENNILLEKEKYLKLRALDLSHWLADIHALTLNIQKKATAEYTDLKTQYYKQALSQFRQRQTDASLRYKKVKAEYDRSNKLHREKVIADAEFENNSFEIDRVRQELYTLTATQLSQWSTDELAYLKEYSDVQLQMSELSKEKERYVIRAPCSGTIMSSSGLYKGSAISAGLALVEISPDTSLITEAYVSPHDIGLLRQSMAVTFEIDAFNYNEWGLASGNVVEIANDVSVVGERPVFKVKCALANNFLQLGNGYKGFLKKGMTLSARFVITQRSLWQLLFDKADDWINPQANRTQS